MHPEIWQPTLATFEVYGHPLPPGVAVKLASNERDYEARKSRFFDDVLIG